MAAHRWGVVAELAAAQHGVVTRAQAAEHEIRSTHISTMVRGGLVDEPRPGVIRLVGSPSTWEQRVTIATLDATGTVASHRTAARLHGFDGFAADEAVEVTVVRGRLPDRPGAILHRARSLDPQDVTVVKRIRVTSVARTLCDLGSVVPDDLVERALDDAVRRGHSMRWIRETLERLHRPGPSGTGSLARVLSLPDRAGALPGSWRERTTERMLRHPELRPIDRQHEIRGADGRVIARPDLAVVDARVGIEYHSDQWHHGPRRGRSDRRRDLSASRVGWELLYLDSADHPDPSGAVEAVLDVVRLRRALLRGTGSAG